MAEVDPAEVSLASALRTPTPPAVSKGNPDRDFTRRVEVKGDSATVEWRQPSSEEPSPPEGEARLALEAQGLDPAEWEVASVRSSSWTMANGELGTSQRFTFQRARATAAHRQVPLDEVVAEVTKHEPSVRRPEGEHGFIVALGDMQFGKGDADGPAGTLRRTVAGLNAAADALAWAGYRYDIGHVHIAWLGDHIEGFTPNNQANAWRTPLTLNEQIRLTRRVMTHALGLFAPMAERVSMAAVPGNHGEPQRFAGKGITRYDDSHDTEALIAVSEAAAMNAAAFGHVEFYVPESDELVVVLDVADTVVGHAHGHKWRSGRHFSWWKGQAFGDTGGSRLRDADVLLAGHYHHLVVDSDGRRRFVQVPALDPESTYYRHLHGTPGAPGLVTMVVEGGEIAMLELIHGA